MIKVVVDRHCRSGLLVTDEDVIGNWLWVCPLPLQEYRGTLRFSFYALKQSLTASRLKVAAAVKAQLN